jgi:hypothetical protein
MPADSYLVIKSPAGVKLAEIDDYLTLACTRRVNEPGLLRFSLRGDHSKIQHISDKSQIVLKRRDTRHDIDWGDEFVGFVRKTGYKRPDREIYELECVGMLAMLGWRVVAYKSGVTSRSVFTSQPVETIIKTLVDYNCCSNATTGNNRLRNGAITNPWTLSIQTNGGNGYSMDRANQGANVLKEVQDILEIAKTNGNGGDIDITQTGAATFRLDWYTGQRGADRSTTVIFAPERGNMASPEYAIDRSTERTVAIVGGTTFRHTHRAKL